MGERMTEEESPLIAKIGQAYLLIGTLSAGTPVPDEEWERALDYFADEGRYDEDFLPWPRSTHSPTKEEKRS